MKFNIWI